MSYTIIKIINILNKNNLNIKYNKINDVLISGIETLNKSSSKQISFFHNIKYKNDLINTKAAACFIKETYLKYVPKDCIPLITDNPYKAFISALNIFYPKKISTGIISKNSFIKSKTKIGSKVEIQDGVIINENIFIGD